MRLAFAVTTFKVQGLSLKDYTIADWTEAGQRHRRGEAYVALSRGEVRQAFHILQVFGKNLRDVFRPSNDLQVSRFPNHFACKAYIRHLIRFLGEF